MPAKPGTRLAGDTVRVGLDCQPAIPAIAQDAFRTRRARTLIPPGWLGLNDHCFFYDANGHIHCLGIRTPLRNPQLFHFASENLDAPFRRLPSIARPQGATGMWAPGAIVHDKQIFVLYTDPASLFRLRPGGSFHMRLMSAPQDQPTVWRHHGIVFSGCGEMRDPCLVYDADQRRFVCYFHRTATPDGRMSAISFKISTDLLHWSEKTWDALTDVYSTLPGGCAESPQVFVRNGVWYLLVTHTGMNHYTRTRVYASNTPCWFGNARQGITELWAHAPEILYENDRWWITSCGHRLHACLAGQFDFHSPGISIAPLTWQASEKTYSP